VRGVVFAAACSIALVGAQYLFPRWAGFHTWQYAALLAICAATILGYLLGARKRPQDGSGRLAIAMFGALIAIVAGIASGLLGPDSETIARAPGTVAPLPDAGAAAFFPNAGPDAIARGDLRVVLRRRNGGTLEIVPGTRRFAGTAALETEPHLAAFIEARDLQGNHLTITQPTNAAFLSPTLFFPQTVTVDGRALPVDAFAVPAVHRQVKAFYFSPEATAAIHAGDVSRRAALLFEIEDDAGRRVPKAIGFDRSGETVTLGGMRLRATIGTYPALVLSAIPSVAAMGFGVVLFVLGLLYAFWPASRRAQLVPAAIVAMMTLNACTRVGTSGTGTAALHSWTRPDTLRIGMYEEPDSLNPVIGSMAFAGDVFQLIFDGLIRFDDRGRPIPDLAREVPSLANGGISKDGKTLTYHLMPNARWHDGVPLTADDVIFTWQQIMNSANLAPTRNGYDRIVRIDAPDPHTVRVHLRGPYPPALYLFRDLNQGAILPKHVLQGNANINRVPFNAHPLGSGPYRFIGWQHGGGMEFEANPDYFRGPPKIKHVSVKFIHDQNTLLAQLRTHEVDVYYDIPASQIDQVRVVPGVRIATTSTLHWEHLNFNTQRPPLDDARVRRALCMAIDEETLHRKIYRGLGTMAPVHFNPDFGWGDRSIRYYPFDPKAAGAVLDGAGWKLAADGLRYRDGKPLAVTISTVAGVKNREAIEVLLQEWWHAIGVAVSVKNFPAATLFAPKGAGGMLYGGKTDVAIFTWQNSTPDPDDETYINPNRLPPIGQNVSFFRNADIGRWEETALQSYDPLFRLPYYLKIQRVLIDQVPEYVLDWLPEITAYNVDLKGVRPVPVGSDLWNIADWKFGV
jgi:peptide/nickel transport system substrate-binding protein